MGADYRPEEENVVMYSSDELSTKVSQTVSNILDPVHEDYERGDVTLSNGGSVYVEIGDRILVGAVDDYSQDAPEQQEDVAALGDTVETLEQAGLRIGSGDAALEATDESGYVDLSEMR